MFEYLTEYSSTKVLKYSSLSISIKLMLAYETLQIATAKVPKKSWCQQVASALSVL